MFNANNFVFNPVSHVAVLVAAALLDYGIGDPWGWPHPVRAMGWVIDRYQQWSIRLLHLSPTHPGHPWPTRIAGIGLGLLLILGSGAVGWAIARFATALHPIIGVAVQAIVLASCFAGRSLRDAAEDVLRPLEMGDLALARDRLSRYVGRDTAHLSSPEILRAVLETVTENATDGVMAPLFYAIVGSIVGSFLPGGSIALSLAYKAASTLDSTVGYREPPYTYLGWFSARTEDLLTWLPCRLTVLTLALMSAQPLRVGRLCWRDARQDPSPNAGWSECAYAAVLGVQLGGENVYRGVVKRKPLLGDARQLITPGHIRRAMGLTRVAFLLWLGGAIALHGLSYVRVS